MANLLNRNNGNCESFRDALEALPHAGGPRRSVEEWRAELPEAEARHLGGCGECRTALEEFVETREALAGFAAPEPGPWFTARVMATIAAKEHEEEARDGVWISVRRLAPRMVALSALLLALGGSWAVRQRSLEVDNLNAKAGDMVFDATAGANGYDDGMGASVGARP
jgi:hypothetical protein